ncbi:hypothetical protein PROFUN_08281 [Planoprotostelium fungivorum]|uniref:Uncharacterized protein n=1 Tax=Planoprotostelium fungivorum TaxID=1890364 RepID=A0A2P6NJY5_9EUKA|nr:hypothetical protein PROFUN_08281 [Planoprotostelium fungivorum]
MSDLDDDLFSDDDTKSPKAKKNDGLDDISFSDSDEETKIKSSHTVKASERAAADHAHLERLHQIMLENQKLEHERALVEAAIASRQSVSVESKLNSQEDGPIQNIQHENILLEERLRRLQLAHSAQRVTQLAAKTRYFKRWMMTFKHLKRHSSTSPLDVSERAKALLQSMGRKVRYIIVMPVDVFTSSLNHNEILSPSLSSENLYSLTATLRGEDRLLARSRNLSTLTSVYTEQNEGDVEFQQRMLELDQLETSRRSRTSRISMNLTRMEGETLDEFDDRRRQMRNEHTQVRLGHAQDILDDLVLGAREVKDYSMKSSPRVYRPQSAAQLEREKKLKSIYLVPAMKGKTKKPKRVKEGDIDYVKKNRDTVQQQALHRYTANMSRDDLIQLLHHREALAIAADKPTPSLHRKVRREQLYTSTDLNQNFVQNNIDKVQRRSQLMTQAVEEDYEELIRPSKVKRPLSSTTQPKRRQEKNETKSLSTTAPVKVNVKTETTKTETSKVEASSKVEVSSKTETPRKPPSSKAPVSSPEVTDSSEEETSSPEESSEEEIEEDEEIEDEIIDEDVNVSDDDKEEDIEEDFDDYTSKRKTKR